MKFKIEKEVFKKFSGLNVGVVVIRDMNNTKKADEINKMILDIEQYTRDNFVLTGFSKSPYLMNWKKAYGGKVKQYHTAVENLMHDVLLGKSIEQSNNLVDLYTYFMLKNVIPIGGDDLDKIKGDVVLKLSDGIEDMRTEHDKLEHPDKGEIIYVDENGVLARRWSWHEADKTKIKHYTKNAVIYFDGLKPYNYQKLEEVLKEFVETVKVFCGGKVRYKILNVVKDEMKI